MKSFDGGQRDQRERERARQTIRPASGLAKELVKAAIITNFDKSCGGTVVTTGSGSLTSPRAAL